MKNILILSLTLFTLLSCSSDDKINSNSIVGVWKLISHSDVDPLPDCMKNSVLTFNSNGSFAGKVYEGDCDENVVSGNFSEVTETIYKIAFPNSNSNTEITAELSSNKLIWIEKNSLTTRTLNFIRS